MAAVFALSSIVTDQPCRLANALVEQAIAAKAVAMKGTEHCDYRLYESLSDLDGDGRDDFALTFNVEGPGNDVHSYLLVCLSSAPAGSAPLEAEVGSRGHYLPAALQAGSKHELVVVTENWRQNDAMCCPSAKAKIVFDVSSGKLRRRK